VQVLSHTQTHTHTHNLNNIIYSSSGNASVVTWEMAVACLLTLASKKNNNTILE